MSHAHLTQPLSILVITVSDRASRGEYEDRSGPAVVEALTDQLDLRQIDLVVVPDDEERLRKALLEGRVYDAVVTTGGTGIGPRDRTPEVTESVCERLLPGIAEFLRAKSLGETAMAPLSRGSAGYVGSTIYVNLPGSVKGASSTAQWVAPLLAHGVAMLAGSGHD